MTKIKPETTANQQDGNTSLRLKIRSRVIFYKNLFTSSKGFSNNDNSIG